MDKLILLFYVLLALAGCDHGRTVVTHSIVDGEDVIDSQIQIVGDLASFRCLRSKTGVCHYTVLPHSCAVTGTGCKRPLSTFSMREGDSLMVTTLPVDFRSCVTSRLAAPDECAEQMATAARATP
ncbi:hypothetical protein ACXU4B_07020 [Dyella soli]|uniref:Uncharacterized protein n=1 Tax=Dyella soli TaxID=522319 RepID=A0A4R0YP46_9GAMM|nr:hypothetical protein [Dyella soli]TCI10729.1 hypothetical protein EZM97_17920 [Dyella soli]